MYGFEGLERILSVHREVTGFGLQYELIFHRLDPEQSEVILDNESLTVSTIPLQHRVPCVGFLFREKPLLRRMLKEKIEQYNIPSHLILDIKKGADFELPDGQIILNDELTDANRAPLAYAYCADTAYTETILPYVEGVDLLYHESTYLKDRTDKAAVRGHATAEEAAWIAKRARVERLLLGHFSSAYLDVSQFQREARTIFPESYVAVEGHTYNLVVARLVGT